VCITLSQNLVNPDGDGMITAFCQDCDEVKRVHADTGLCDDCEENYVYCSVCDVSHHEDQTCRHLFWDGSIGWWAGPGSDDPCCKIEKYQKAVRFALQQLAPGVLVDLGVTLQNGTLEFCLCGTTFGVDAIEFHGRDEVGAWVYRQNIVEDMHGKVRHEFTERESHWFEMGFYWLMALDKKTPRETALVLQWTEEVHKGVHES
jgi:hypothetical protein